MSPSRQQLRGVRRPDGLVFTSMTGKQVDGRHGWNIVRRDEAVPGSFTRVYAKERFAPCRIEA